MAVVHSPSTDGQGPFAPLADIAERAVHVTGAQGAAIALHQDGLLVTVASSGACAPDVGVPVRDTSFAGRCFEQATALICTDTETDSRVDPAACRLLDIRSMVAVPIRHKEQLRGVLAVFARVPNHFKSGEVGLARTLATIAGDLIGPTGGAEKAPTAPGEPAGPPQPHVEPVPNPVAKEPEKVSPTAPKAAAKEPEKLSPPAPVQPPKRPIGIVAQQSRPLAHSAAELESTVAPNKPEVLPVADVQASRPAAKLHKPAPIPLTPKLKTKPMPPPPPQPVEPVVLPAAEDPEPLPLMQVSSAPTSTLASYAQPKRLGRMLGFAGAAVAVLAIVATVWLMRTRAGNGDKTARVLAAEPASSSPSVPMSPVSQNPATTVAPVAKTVVHVAKTSSSPIVTPAAPKEAAKVAKNAAPEARTPSPEEPKTRASSPTAAQTPLVVRTTASSDPREPYVPAPTIALAQSSAPLLATAAKPYVPSAPVSQLVPAQLVRKVAPIYPAAALATGAQGKVVVSAVVLKDGSIGQVSVVSGSPALRNAAISAVKQWAYKPAYLNGKPAESTVSVEINFTRSR